MEKKICPVCGHELAESSVKVLKTSHIEFGWMCVNCDYELNETNEEVINYGKRGT